MARTRKQAPAMADTLVKWNIALYIRLSREDGNDESASITEQRKILMEYVERHFCGDYAIVDIYCDDGLTGTDDTRDAFQRMIHDVYAKKVNCVICKTLSRAFRNYADQGRYLEEVFPRFGVRFISEGNPHVDSYLHADAIQNGMEIPINGLMNDRFAAKTSTDVRRTFQAKRSRGEFIGAFAPYGYRKDPDNRNALLIDEEAAAVVRDIFHWYVYGNGSSKGGMSKEGIARKLNEQGVPNPGLYKKRQGQKYYNPQLYKNDGLWGGTTISRMLKNRMYIGTMVQGQQRVISYKVHHTIRVPEEEWFQVENTHEAIIARDLFDVAQKLQMRDTRAAPEKRETYLFSGFLRCADCGKAMTRRAAKGYVYYNCSTYKRKSREKCSKHSMRLDVLEAAVLASIRKQIELADLSALMARVKTMPALPAKRNRLSNLLALRRQELEKTEAITVDLYADWKTGEITQEQYRRMTAKFTEQEAQLHKAIAALEAELLAQEHERTDTAPALQSFLKHGNITALTQSILVELVDYIDVHEGGALTIVFKLEDPYKRLLDRTEAPCTVLEGAESGGVRRAAKADTVDAAGV